MGLPEVRHHGNGFGALKEFKDPAKLITSNFKIILAAIVIFALVIWPSLSLSIVYAQERRRP